MFWGDHVRLIVITFTLLVIHFKKASTREQTETLYKISLRTTSKPHRINDSMAMDTLIKINGSTGVRKPQNPAALIPFTGLTDSHKINKNCCMNGGTCVLGTFCACQKPFTGRYCEFDERKKNCANKIKHGDWVLRGCRLCRCTYGLLNCLKEVMQAHCDPTSVDANDARLELFSCGTMLHPLTPIIFLMLTGSYFGFCP
ncbi:cryptic protein-like [Hyla sarda]|uniref:cryptic protein-like n=1 Tax=Hyla sarda TaxID=327740 RepID=UPI0024C2900B|nr:cryptic protein-like [Hyla sarda]